MSVVVTYTAQVKVVETLAVNTGSASATNRVVTHDQYDESGQYTGATSPPVTTVAEFLQALTAGAATIDLRALTGTNGGAVDGNGLKVQMLRVKNLGANNLTLSEGASNGYAIGAGIVVPPGGHVQFFGADGFPDIDATHKTIDLAGTGAQTSEITIVMG